jgi:hypothetical protein
VLDALAFSPVRTKVTPIGIPAEPTPELVAAVKKVAARLPQIAALFGIEATAPSKSKPAAKPRPPKPVIADAPAATEASADTAAPAVAAEDSAPAVEAVETPEAPAETAAETTTEAPSESTPEESAVTPIEEVAGDDA